MNRSNPTLPEAMLRTLRLIFSPGLLAYAALFAIFNLMAVAIRVNSMMAQVGGMMAQVGGDGAPSPSPMGDLILLPITIVIGCKIVDTAARIRAGRGDEGIPMALLSELDSIKGFLSGLLRLFLLIFLVAFLFAALGLAKSYLDDISLIIGCILAAIAPAMILSYLDHGTGASMFNAANLREAIGDIGGGRYLLLLVTIVIIAFTYSYIETEVLRPMLTRRLATNLLQQMLSDKEQLAIPSFVYLYGGIIGFITALVMTFNSLLPAWFYPRTNEDDETPTQDDHIAASLHTAANPRPQSLSPAASRQQQTPPAQPAAASLHKTPTTQPAAAEPDFRLLADADTRDMGIETQKAFALALARADALIRRGDNLSAIALLKTYANEQRDVAAYFPAYARLYRLEPQPALLHRLIHSAATGHRPSYDLIHDTLEHSDPASLPADSILPLAQQAGKQQHYRTVLNLTRNFAKNHPNHPHLVENYYLAALALAKTGAVDKALPLLQQLHTRYPDHPRAAIIAQAIARLQGKP